MTPLTYRLPNGAFPVLLSADTPDLVHDEAAALLSYATEHPEVAPQAIADMLFRTRIARRHRALAMVTDRDDLLGALRAVVDGREHPALVRADTAAATRRIAYVFPGQGVQRPGMGRQFYESIPAFRAEAQACAAAFHTHVGASPLDYLLDEQLAADDAAGTVQPALFTFMAGLAATWRSFGIAPGVTVGHSQGEIAAAYVSGAITLDDAVRVVGIRAHAADEFGSGDFGMAVVAASPDTCAELLARCPGWAELSAVNSPGMVGISGDRETVRHIVDTLGEQGTFARVIRVRYPAHTSLIDEFADALRAAMQRELRNPKFLDSEIDCVGSTLGVPIPRDVPVDQYWFWNLRNTVRFDQAVDTALRLGSDTFVELADHPTLQLAIQDNLSARHDDDHDDRLTIGTSNRTATDLGEFTRNLARLAVHDLDYRWECLGSVPSGPTPLPLADFPNTRMAQTRLWLPYRPGPEPVAPVAKSTPARRFVEEWVRLSQRTLLAPRAVGIVDHTGACAELATAVCRAAEDLGGTARLVNGCVPGDLDTLVIILPRSPELDDDAAAAEVATFFSDRTWWPGLNDAVTDCWLVTVGGEAVLAGDAPDPVHAAASAGFRSMGADHPGVGFRHLDLPATAQISGVSANGIVAALHTGQEPELALRDGVLYAKRIAARDPVPASPSTALPEHVLVIGGTGNLGLEFCEHFAQRGARRITLVSRSGGTAAAADRLRQIRSATTTDIRVARCDVTDKAAVSRLAAEYPPTDLIIHAAVDYSAVELADITIDKAERALRPKVIGIAHVLDTFPRTGDCRVILCSSARATIGGRGQVLYAAANRMLDAIAFGRRARGLDCVSVQWGQWTVHFELDAKSTAQLAAIGLVPMSPADALAVGMTGFRDNAIVLACDFDRARPVLEAYGYGPLVSALTSPAAKASAETGGRQSPAAAKDLMSLLAQTIGADSVDDIDTTVPMVAIGLDSLQALELRRRVKTEFNHDLEISDLLGGASMADLLAKLGSPN